MIHFGLYGKNMIITRDGLVVKKEDLEIPISFYVVDKSLTQDIPLYASNDAWPNHYRRFLYLLRYSLEEIDRVIEISSSANIKGD